MKNIYVIPLSIIIAGGLVGVGVAYGLSKLGSGRVAVPEAPTRSSQITLREVTKEDHILGNPTAPVKVVEFADTECPFCKRFHPTMHELINEYGKEGKVAWVYRHFPLDQIHPKTRKEAEATECANELGGNNKFWQYVDRLYEITPSNNNLDLALLPRVAEYVGLDRSQFETCLDSGKYAQHIQEDLDDAIRSGGQGTPWSIVIAPTGKKFPIQGAQPYGAVKSIIDLALQEK